MKQHVTKILSVLMSVLFLSLFMACEHKDDPVDTDPDDNMTAEQRINKQVNAFTVNAMKKYYLWNENIPASITSESTENPLTFFEKMRYADNANKWADKWTRLINNASSDITRSEVDEVTTGFGYEIGRFAVEGGIYYMPVILFVYPDSPASRAGLKRGDVIFKVNDQFLTESAYDEFYYSTKPFKLEKGRMYVSANGLMIESTNEAMTMYSSKQYFDTVVEDKIIEAEGKKVGYLFYAGYTKKSKTRLAEVLANFKKENVDDIILDLRYNGGGYVDAAIYLCSMLAPENIVNNESVLFINTWNRSEMERAAKEKEDLNDYFDPTVPVNMNLNKLYVLTGTSTASASEATIVGLGAYDDMEVIQIGETTHGKFCGGFAYTPANFYGKDESKYKDIKDWEFQTLIAFKYADKNGYTDFKNGLTPAKENLVNDYVPFDPLGSEDDHLVARALDIIEGISPVRAVSRSSEINRAALTYTEGWGGMLLSNDKVVESLYK